MNPYRGASQIFSALPQRPLRAQQLDPLAPVLAQDLSRARQPAPPEDDGAASVAPAEVRRQPWALTRGLTTGRRFGSTSSRRCSKSGGSESFSPRLSTGSSTVNPGPSVAISKSTPLGSRK